MEQTRLEGRKILAEALGDKYLENRDETTNDFNRPLREFSEAAATASSNRRVLEYGREGSIRGEYNPNHDH